VNSDNVYDGWTENAGPENGGPKKMKEMKMQDLKMTDQMSGRDMFRQLTDRFINRRVLY